MSRTRGSSAAIRRGVKTRLTMLRSRVWAGGSEPMIAAAPTSGAPARSHSGARSAGLRTASAMAADENRSGDRRTASTSSWRLIAHRPTPGT